jgi:hypothetical protein
LHDLVGRTGIAGEDETFGEGGIEATMGGLGKPDEVFRTVVRSDTVEMVTIVGMQMPIWDLGRRRQPFDRSWSDESKGDSMMDEDVAIAVRHLVIDLLSPTVFFALWPGSVLGSELVVGAMMEGVQDSFGRGKEGVSAGS